MIKEITYDQLKARCDELEDRNQLLNRLLFEWCCIQVNMGSVGKYSYPMSPRQTGDAARERVAEMIEKRKLIL